MAGLSAENPFRNVFNRRVIEDFSRRITKVYPAFDAEGFVKLSLHRIKDLGLLQRSDQICEALQKTLPDHFPEAARILVESLGDPLPDPGKTDWDSFIVMPQTRYVARYGLDHYDLSMQTLYQMTQRFSAEGDLRIFIELDYDRTMKILRRWTKDPSEHVRRLVSEGTRPRLPMSGRIRRFQEDPRPLFELLDQLKDDASLYVRRSVANNLNDISKDNPELMLDLLEKWNVDPPENRRWIIRHALRTLIKKGNGQALHLAGASIEARAAVSRLKLHRESVSIGEAVYFSFQIRSEARETATFVIDYDLHFIKSNGSSRPKRFKLRRLTLQPGEERTIEARYNAVSTSGRTLFPGQHSVDLHVNGQAMGSVAFMLH